MLPYLKLLIRQRIAAWNLARYFRENRHKGRAVATLIGFAVGTLSLYGMLVGLEYLLYGAFVQLGEPQTLLALTVLFCTLMTLITSFFYILGELFFSKDLTLVSALPITSRELLTAKMLRIWVGEAGIALAICLPAILLYGIGQGMGVLYYLRALLLTLCVPLAPLAVVALLSFVLIRISALWKRREALTVVMSMLFMIAFMWVQMSFSMSVSDDNMRDAMLQLLLRQKQLLDLVVGIFPPVRWFQDALLQPGWAAVQNGLLYMGMNIAALALVVLALGGGYQRLAIRQSEAFTRMNARAGKRKTRMGERTPLAALFHRELREIFTVPIYTMNCLAPAVMFPVITIAMVFSAGQASTELSVIPMLLTMLPKPMLTGIAAGVFALTGTMNMAISTSVSREGKRHEFFRTLPVAPQTQLLAKLLMGLTLNMVETLPMVILAAVLLPALSAQVWAGWVCSFLFTTATSIFGLMVDAAHPKFGWKNETEAIKQNGLAALTMFGGMFFLAACGAAVYGLTLLHWSTLNAFAVVCVAVAVVDGLLMRRLMGRTSTTYILQEVRN